jgi:hypothetical protein
MRRIVRVAGGALAAAAVLLVAPVPASAGGPTSVLLASPARQAAAALYYSDAAYHQLQQLLGENPTPAPGAPDMAGGPGTSAINITWMIHDVQVWRVDRVFLNGEVAVNGDAGPWIVTHLMQEKGSLFDTPGVVHKASDPKALVDLLSGLKLLGEASPANQGVRAPAAGTPPTVSQPVVTAASEREVADLNWLWLLIGAAAGAVVVIGARPLLVRGRRPN